jgi:hypothetical protein
MMQLSEMGEDEGLWAKVLATYGGEIEGCVAIARLQAATLNIGNSEWANAALLECYESGPVRAAREDRHCKSILPDGGSGECCTVRAFFDHFVEEGNLDINEQGRFLVPWKALVGDEHPGASIRKLQKTLTTPYKRQLLRHFGANSSNAARVRIQSARGPGASAFLSCLPVCPQTTVGDMELRTVLRLRLGTPILSGLPAHCVCRRATDLSTDAYHLLACPTLNSSKGSQSLRVEWPANTWNERHQLVKDAISAHLASAGVCVIDEPGPLHGDLEDGAPRPGLTSSSRSSRDITRGDGHAIARVCTDV